jgi:hypothetical protein
MLRRGITPFARAAVMVRLMLLQLTRRRSSRSSSVSSSIVMTGQMQDRVRIQFFLLIAFLFFYFVF